jgi:hypothetical protein
MKLESSRIWLSGAVAGLMMAAPQTVQATQAHGAPEGIIGHQLAHLIFMLAMAILIYWLRSHRLVAQTGWRYIQYAAFFFILWNLDTFFAHLVDEQLLLIRVETVDFWHRHIESVNAPAVFELFYYAAKLDHLLCVPAMFFLYLGLRRLLKTPSQESILDGQP